jgi:hypothetical protein
MSEKEEQEEEQWQNAEVIFGRLVGVYKSSQRIAVEYKADDDWVTTQFSTQGLTDEDYDELKERLGRDIELRVVDNKVEDWE